MSSTKKVLTEHDIFHEKGVLWGVALVLFQVLLAYIAPVFFDGNLVARQIFLLPTIPVAFVVISHWLAGLVPAEKCTCGKNTKIIK
jgi:hypothetical protein